jgi:hypothetical protein
MRRRFDDRGLFVAIHDDSWEKLIPAATQMLSLPDEYYEKLVYCRALPFPVLQELLTMLILGCFFLQSGSGIVGVSKCTYPSHFTSWNVPENEETEKHH